MMYSFLSVVSLLASAFIVGILLQEMHPLNMILPFEIGAVLGAAFYLGVRGSFWQAWEEFKKNWKPATVLLLFGIGDSLGWFFSLYYNGLSGHALLSRLIPLVLLAYGALFLKERLSVSQWLAASLIILGSFLYAFQRQVTQEIAALIAVSVQIICYSGFSIQQKRLANKMDPMFLLLLRSFFIMLVSIIFLNLLFEMTSLKFSACLLVLSVLGGICGAILNHYFTMKAYAVEKLVIVTVIRNSSQVFIFLFGAFILNEISTPLQWLAAALTLTGVGLLVGRHLQETKK